MKKKDTVLSILQEIRNLLKQETISTKVILPAPRQINDRFIDNNDGTISDKQFNVIWVKDPTVLGAVFQKTMTFEEAKEACEKLSYAGYNSGWRLPTIEELRSIIDYSRSDPAWDTDVFAGKHNDWYWTSTPCAWDSDAAWCVGSVNGVVFYDHKYGHYYVRPVRSSQ